jgi:epoxyqueuosine reductase
MEYMSQNFDLRTNPTQLVPGAKSVIVVLKNYFPSPNSHLPGFQPKISKYAWGEDYHLVIKDQLAKLYRLITNRVGAEFNARGFVDSAPVMDKAWAQRAGLGWIGKHTNLIRPKAGSWFFIGTLICDLPLPADNPIADYCGDCTRCIDACPTDALTPYKIDARKCISYLTIELKASIPEEFHTKMEGWAYGCDICQDVCPWNRHSKPNDEARFTPIDFLLHTHPDEIRSWSNRQFSKVLQKSAINRIKREKYLENLDLAS